MLHIMFKVYLYFFGHLLVVSSQFLGKYYLSVVSVPSITTVNIHFYLVISYRYSGFFCACHNIKL